MLIPHSKPTLDANDALAIKKVIQSGFISQGKQVAAFEKKLALYQKARGAVALSSGTAALHLALLALDVKKGDQVIIPSYVCTALLNAVNYTGGEAKIVDVRGDTFNIDAAAIEKAITKKTKAIIVPHMFGHPADIIKIKKFGISIIEDCAQSIGAKINGMKAGTFGTISIFSFYATKMLTTGEGGMITANNKKLLDKIRDLRDYDHKQDVKLRFNYKMTDMQAALGICQLKKLPEMIKKREMIAKKFNQAFCSNKAINIPAIEKNCGSVYFRYIIKSTKSNAARIIKKFKSKGVNCEKPVFKPLHQSIGKPMCPISEQLNKTTISVPIYPTLTTNQINHIIKTLNKII